MFFASGIAKFSGSHHIHIHIETPTIDTSLEDYFNSAEIKEAVVTIIRTRPQSKRSLHRVQIDY
jgi:hypothetical protein